MINTAHFRLMGYFDPTPCIARWNTADTVGYRTYIRNGVYYHEAKVDTMHRLFFNFGNRLHLNPLVTLFALANMDNKTVTCVICNKPVSLETTRTDEDGQPVHEECYVLRVRPESLPGKK
jgi:hypothetical protein